MAVCSMFGLSFVVVLSLLVMPALYSTFYNAREESMPASAGSARIG
jgi:hypothetical protein